MLESDIYRPSLPYFQNMDSFLENIREDQGFCMDADMCYSLARTDEISDNLFSYPYLETILQDRYLVDFQDHLDDDMEIMTTRNISEYLKDLTLINGETSDVSAMTMEESKGGFHSHQQSPIQGVEGERSLDVTSMPPSLVLPTEGMEIDNDLGVFHLLMAYAEATEMEQQELADVIAIRIGERVSPLGDTVERLMYNMFQILDKQSDYLKQESIKNFYLAFKAFYQIFPNGKFAHFAANLAILEALPNDVSIIRIFDFDIGKGIQWASLIEAIGHQPREVILTSIKFGEADSNWYPSPLTWKFDDTKNRLCDYASSYGLKLQVEETELNGLVVEIKNNIQQERLGRREFHVFNAMVSLPHMGRVRSRKDVLVFLQVAQDFLQNAAGRGMITFGDGDSWEKVRNATSFGSFLDGNMAHYQALLESLELNFPAHLGEARTVMECLFVSPFVSSLAWSKAWEERKKYGNLEFSLALRGWKLSQENLVEAKEVVREGESLFRVRIEGESNNEMVMDWRGIPMVRVSCWRS